MAVLKHSFFLRPDIVLISRQLLGKYLFTHLNNNEITGGIIIETEAYAGPEDKASHAYGNRRTKRTETMFHKGGIAYVYLCYGMHSLFNIVTNKQGIPHAVLIRAIHPTRGIKTMLKRRGKKYLTRTLTSGPGSLTKALGINTSHNGTTLTEDRIWLEDLDCSISHEQIYAGPRVGVSYAGVDANLPWRFRIREKR